MKEERLYRTRLNAPRDPNFDKNCEYIKINFI